MNTYIYNALYDYECLFSYLKKKSGKNEKVYLAQACEWMRFTFENIFHCQSEVWSQTQNYSIFISVQGLHS